MKKNFLSLIAATLSVIFVLSCTALISFAAPSADPVVLMPETELHSGNDNSNSNRPCDACTAIFSGTDYYKIDQGNGTAGVFTAKRSADGTSTLLTVSKTVTVSLIILKAAAQHQIYINPNGITLTAGTVYRLNSTITNKNGNAQAISHITMYGVSEAATSSEATSSEATSSEATSSEATSSEATSSEATSSEATSSEATSSEATSSEATSSEATSSEATSSEATSSEATSSEATSSEATSSEATSSEATSSEATSSTESEEEIPDESTPLVGPVSSTGNSSASNNSSPDEEELILDESIPLAGTETPATGAESMLPLVIAAAVLSLVGAVWVILKRRQDASEE